MLDLVTLTGSHVRLEPLTLDHVPALVEAASGPRDSFVYTNVPESEAAMRAYVESALQSHATGDAFPFATIDARTSRLVGSTRFGNIEYWTWPGTNPLQRAPGQPDAVGMGWTWLTPQAQRTGINTEAKLLMLAHAFETWRVHRVTIRTDERNARSRAAIERLGASLDGILRAAQPAFDGVIRDTAFYSILATEWPNLKPTLEARLLPR